MFMLTIFIFSILGAVWTINITIIENQVNGTEQLSVYLPVVVTFPENFHLTWRIGGTQIASLTAGGTPAYWSGYGGRAELYPNNGTLRLDRLQLTDTGDYTIRVINQNNSDSSEATISLAVHPAAPTVGITVIENPVNGTRGQAAYFLVQISFPTQFELHWRIKKTGQDIASLLSGGTPVYNGPYRGRAQLFPENGTLRLDNLADSDSGSYKVSLFNGDLGTQTEAVLQLNVYRSATRQSIVKNWKPCPTTSITSNTSSSEVSGPALPQGTNGYPWEGDPYTCLITFVGFFQEVREDLILMVV